MIVRKHGVLPICLRPLPDRKHADAVFSSFPACTQIGKRLAQYFSESREGIDLANRGRVGEARRLRIAIADSTGRPRNQKRNAMPTLVARRFVASKRTGCDVAVLFRPVVTREDDDGIPDQFGAGIPGVVIRFQPINKTPEDEIVFVDKIMPQIHRPARLRSRSAAAWLSADFFIRRIGRMVRRRRIIEKERMLRILFSDEMAR